MPDDVRIEKTTWAEDESALRAVRKTVFMDEQQVPEELEWDGEDETAVHLLARTSAGEVVGCARILRDGHIGRMAVLRQWRQRGIGRALLRQAIVVVTALGCREAFLDAQTHALPFYEQEGFHAQGDVFMDAGIAHRHMRREL